MAISAIVSPARQLIRSSEGCETNKDSEWSCETIKDSKFLEIFEDPQLDYAADALGRFELLENNSFKSEP